MISKSAKLLIPDVWVQHTMGLEWPLKFPFSTKQWKPIFTEQSVSSKS